MSKLSAPSALETASGSLVTESALTAIAAIAGGPLAPLLPVLAKSFAATRQQQRVAQALAEISAVLQQQERAVTEMSDAQYKLVNEAVLALLQTTQTEKLEILRNAVRNTLTATDVRPHEAVLLSRIVRDISPEEVTFLARAFAYSGVHFFAEPSPLAVNDDTLSVALGSSDALLVSGLLSLGILTPAESSWDGIGVMRFSRLAGMLLALVGPSGASHVSRVA